MQVGKQVSRSLEGVWYYYAVLLCPTRVGSLHVDPIKTNLRPTNEENEAKQMIIPRKIRCTEKYDNKPAPINETGDSNANQVYDIPHV